MVSEDPSYYQMRAEAEVEMACRSTDPIAVQAHYDLSAAYLELVYGAVDQAGRSAAD
jgi:hypothetical protein